MYIFFIDILVLGENRAVPEICTEWEHLPETLTLMTWRDGARRSVPNGKAHDVYVILISIGRVLTPNGDISWFVVRTCQVIGH